MEAHLRRQSDRIPRTHSPTASPGRPRHAEPVQLSPRLQIPYNSGLVLAGRSCARSAPGPAYYACRQAELTMLPEHNLTCCDAIAPVDTISYISTGNCIRNTWGNRTDATWRERATDNHRLVPPHASFHIKRLLPSLFVQVGPDLVHEQTEVHRPGADSLPIVRPRHTQDPLAMSASDSETLLGCHSTSIPHPRSLIE
eukprot:848618-Rhodomonas_salina.2